MRRALLGTNVVALALGSVYLWMAFGYERGTPSQPGPGFYPQCVGALLVLAALCSLVSDLRRHLEGEWILPKGRELGRLLSVMAGIAGYVALLNFAGHLLSATLLVFVVLHTMGLRSWPVKIGLTVAFALGSYYLFDVLLMVSLPRGIFE